MKGKKLFTIGYDDMFSGLLTGFGGMAFESPEQKRSRLVANTKSDNYIVDTCFAPDTGYYETGVSYEKLNDGKWIIVEHYKNKKAAKTGHNKWVEYMKKQPKQLTDVSVNHTFR